MSYRDGDRPHEHLCRHCFGAFACYFDCPVAEQDGKLLGGMNVCPTCENRGLKNVEVIHPIDKWPYGRPEVHERCCVLFDGKDYCDCKASDASDLEWGEKL